MRQPTDRFRCHVAGRGARSAVVVVLNRPVPPGTCEASDRCCRRSCWKTSNSYARNSVTWQTCDAVGRHRSPAHRVGQRLEFVDRAGLRRLGVVGLIAFPFVDERIDNRSGIAPLPAFGASVMLVPPCRGALLGEITRSLQRIAVSRELLRKVQADCAIEVDGNAYSVPWRLIGETVRVVVSGGQLRVSCRSLYLI
jgi:Mu transposase-like protein